ncbi:MAG: hypothetical protein KIS94_00800 [Chitinophagales bacterium]|nr:hypothetical protein [Chitinophagales bacterium]
MSKRALLKYVLYPIVVIFLIILVANFVSKRLLQKEGLLPADGIVNTRIFSTEINLYTGGLDNTPYYSYTGYNDSLKLGNVTFSDQLGFLHGDSLPLKIKKPVNTLRVVLMGGSGMRGNLQTHSMINMFNYPEGSYDYETSIAGKLKVILKKAFPEKNIEVINTAVPMRQFHQSLAGYFQKVQQLKPDVVVTMDGANDDLLPFEFESNGNPYLQTSEHAEQGIDLEVLKRASRFGYTWMFLSYKSMHGPVARSDFAWDDIKSLIHKVSAKDLKYFVGLWQLQETLPHSITFTEKDFEPVKPFMVQNMNRQLELYASYSNQLKHDSVFSVVCYQPILHRYGGQKKLSNKEKSYAQFFVL